MVKSTTSLTIRQLICYWLLWLMVAFTSLGLCLLCTTVSSTSSESTGRQADPWVAQPEELLAPIVRRGDGEGLLFPWRLKRSRRRCRMRLPGWLVSLRQWWAVLCQMRGWNMAQWVAFLSRYQVCRLVGGLLFLYPIVKELEVAEIVNQYSPSEAEVGHGTVVSVLVLNRLTSPRPLYKIARWMAFTILPLVLGVSARKFNDDRLGRTLDAIEPHLQEIWMEIVIRALEHYDIDTSVIFYDLTAFVMEGEYKDSKLADFGFAHNTPTDKRKVKWASNATQDGSIVFDWAAVCGRVADTATAEENMQQLRRVMRRQKWPKGKRRLVVGDRAMLNSRLAIAYDALKKDQVYYLAGLEPRTKEHKKLLNSVPLPELRANYLMGEDGQRYWGVKRPITFIYEDEETGEKQEVTHTALIVLSEATRRSWRRKRFAQLRELSSRLQEEVQDKLNQPYWRNPETIRKRVQSRLDDSPVGEVIKVEVWGESGEVQMRWWIDRKAWRDLCHAYGRYLLVSDDPTLSCVEMLQTYKNKDGLDKRFRVSKQVLRVRPVYLHKDGRIQALMLVNMIALLVYSLAERRCRRSGLQITGQEMLYEFAPLHVVETHCWDGSVLRRCMPLTSRQKEILQQMGLAAETSLDPVGWTANGVFDAPFTLPPPAGQPPLRRAEPIA
jgi:transposase